MKTQVKQPEAVSHTIQGKNRASKQASVESVLQKMESKTVESVELKMESENPLSTLNSQFSTNETGIPDTMKANFENFSGFSFDDVRVHYNSPKPAQLQALAYTQGNQVHIAPGQEKHLGHELGHVVQQKQGRVQPTMQLQGVNVNDNEGLEREADIFGAKAVQMIPMDNLFKDEKEPLQMQVSVGVLQRAETIDTTQVNNAQIRINNLNNLYNNNLATLNNIIAGANIVYRQQQALILTNLNNDLIARRTATNALIIRGQNLVAGTTQAVNFKNLLRDISSEYKQQKHFQNRLAAQNALSINPQINANVATLNGATHNVIVGQINTWNGGVAFNLGIGGGGVIAGTFFKLLPFNAHPADPCWEIRYQAIAGWVVDPNGAVDPHLAPNNIYSNGSIPTTTHGAPNLPAARNYLITQMNLAGYI